MQYFSGSGAVWDVLKLPWGGVGVYLYVRGGKPEVQSRSKSGDVLPGVMHVLEDSKSAMHEVATPARPGANCLEEKGAFKEDTLPPRHRHCHSRLATRCTRFPLSSKSAPEHSRRSRHHNRNSKPHAVFRVLGRSSDPAVGGQASMTEEVHELSLPLSWHVV